MHLVGKRVLQKGITAIIPLSTKRGNPSSPELLDRNIKRFGFCLRTTTYSLPSVLTMREIYTFLLGVIITCNGLAQNYSLNPTGLNAQGNPGDFLLSTLIVNNTSGNNITMHVKRIVKNLPPNWTSCFCFPVCVAPFIDTLTFNIPPYSMDSIKPNYHTDPSTLGIGYVTIILYQVDYPNNIDTVVFSGSTMSSSGISTNSFASNFTSFPNPFSNTLTLLNNNSESYSASVYNSTGEVVYRKENVSSTTEPVNLEFLPDGIYFIKLEFTSGKIISNRVIKSK